MGLERFTKDVIRTGQGGKIVTLCNAEAITDTNNHDYYLIAQGGLSAEEIRTFCDFKISVVNTHNQIGDIRLWQRIDASSNFAAIYIEEDILPATTGVVILQSKAVGTGGDSFIKTVSCLEGIFSDMFIRVQFDVAPASGALTIVAIMH